MTQKNHSEEYLMIDRGTPWLPPACVPRAYDAVQPPSTSTVLSADVAELVALAEAFQWFLEMRTLGLGVRVITILPDSDYCYNVCVGNYFAKSHLVMAQAVRDLYVNVRIHYLVHWKVLKSHSDIWQNERCDKYAKQGAKGLRREAPAPV